MEITFYLKRQINKITISVMWGTNKDEAGKWIASDRPYFVDLLIRKVLSEDVTFQRKPQ